MEATARDAAVQAVHNLFIWLNRIGETKEEITAADVAKIFTEDTVMTLNSRFICSGIEGQLEHSRDLQHKMRSFRFNMPFEQTIVEGDSVVGYYTCDFVSKEGVAGRAYDLCIWKLRDGRIASILENVIFEGQEIDVAVCG